MKYEVTITKTIVEYAIVEVDAASQAAARAKARRLVTREPRRFCDGDQRVRVKRVEVKP